MKEKNYLDDLKKTALDLPEQPGVYQFYDSENRLIYVGKAKNLKKRVLSYFSRNLSGKTLVMRNRIRSIKEIIVESESEALLLENNLIKKYQPRYNVLLKDDKSYPWICISNEPFPRVFMTRNLVKDGSEYFGPYTSVLMVKTLLELIRQLFKLRTCRLNLSESRIIEGNYRLCLEYQLGNCEGPCTGLQKEQDYNKSIEHVREILKGNIHSVNIYLKNLMKKYSSGLMYEEAQLVKEKIAIIDKYRSRSTVVNPRINDADVFAYVSDGNNLYISYISILKGAVVQTRNLELKRKLDEDTEELLSLAITEVRHKRQKPSREIILPVMPGIKEEGVKYTVPQKGDRKRLLDLAERNAKFHKVNATKKKYPERYAGPENQKLLQLKNDLRLPEYPRHIECFDNSNIQGSDPVAACVVFINGRASKKEYRHYKIKSVMGANDFASMEEVVYRRYKRLKEEMKGLPQLIIIDGGKGQLSAAVKSLEKLGLRGKISIIGIAKKLEEIYFPGDPVPLYIDKKSSSLKLIQQLRNEAHRFGINFHRDRRSAGMIKSELDDVKGIGKQTKEKLLREFHSIEQLAAAEPERLDELLGPSKSEIIRNFLKNRPGMQK